MKLQDTGIKPSPWSHLPLDLSQQTFDKLYFLDQIRFRAVCKNWNAAQYKRKPSDSLPWVVKVKQTSINMFECVPYEQSSLNVFTPITVDKIYLDQFVTSYPLLSFYRSPIEISCKHGWLLFKIPDKDFRGATFLYYSLLTRKSIVLPYLLYQVSSHSGTRVRTPVMDVITASSVEPNSPDCVFVALEFDFMNKKRHIISTFRHGQNRWCVTEYLGRNFPCYDCKAVYVQNIFYFMNSCGKVASYNITNGNWKVEDILADDAIKENLIDYVTELNGKLMILYYDDDDYDEIEHCCLKLFDWSKKAWVRVNSLEDQVLLFSPGSSSVLVGGEEATNNGLSANKIYILETLDFYIFSVKSGDFVNRVNWDTYESVSGMLKTFWLEPPGRFLDQKQPSRTSEDVVDDQRVVGQLKGSGSGPREPRVADVKHYGMAKSRKRSRKD